MSSYLVIARKWRPRVFEEIIGQDHVTRTLQNAITSGRVAQAYLFSGPRGVGKTTAARILAKCLNCTGDATAPPCNECASCRAITSGSSVDVIEIDGASNTGVENVRDLRENIMYMPAGGGRKIYIIDEVHMLSIAAFNALLKTLEEPPPHVVFIFATTEVRKIPLTILSRCQRFEFRRIPVSKIEAHLKMILEAEKIDFEEGALFAIAREADGSLRDAESLLDQVLAFGGENVRLVDVTGALGLMDRAVLLELMDAVLKKDGASALKIIEKIYDFGYDLKRASAELLSIVRDMTALRVTGGSVAIEAPAHELKALGEMAAGLNTEDLHMLFLLIQKGYEGIARSAFARHSFEMTVLRASSFDSLRPLDELLKGLNALGKRGPGSGGGGGGEGTRRQALRGAPGRADKSHGDKSLAGKLPWEREVPEKGVVQGKRAISSDGPEGHAEKGQAKEGCAKDETPEKSLGNNDPRDFTGGHGIDPGGPEIAPVPEAPPIMPPHAAMEAGTEYLSPGDNTPIGPAEEDAAGGVPSGVMGVQGIEGLMACIKDKGGPGLYALLRGSEMELRDNRVEIKSAPQDLRVLEMKKAGMEKLFSQCLGSPVEVVLRSGQAAAERERDPVDLLRRVLGARVLEDSYVEGG